MNNNLQNNTLKENTTAQKSADPILCVKCSQFFGNPAQDNLCSKCQKDVVRDQLKAKAAAREKEREQEREFELLGPAPILKKRASSVESPRKLKAPEESKDVEKPKQTDKTKCFGCNRRIGMLGYECRCGYAFCKNHRLPEDHNCTFNYSALEREKLKQTNPVVAASKLEKF